MFGYRVTIALLVIMGALTVPASAVRLLGIRTAPHGDSLRVVLDLAAKTPVRLTSETDGRQWRILLSGVEAKKPLRNIDRPLPWIDSIESSLAGDDLQVLVHAGRPARATPFWIPGGKGKPWRYVVDLAPAGTATDADAAAGPGPPKPAPSKPPAQAGTVASKPVPATPAPPLAPEPGPRKEGKWRILIDPGHGGNDPGARRGKLVEKEIVFDVARRLEALLDGSKDCEARLSRKDDRRIGLRERHELADAYNADAFVSIHVNAAPAKQALGVEVFFLSMGGASDEASRELASYENEADPGYVFEEDSLLQGIPFSFDLRQSDTLMRSSRLAESILGSLESSHLAASRGVKQAGFGVLKSFQVPSVLVEVGFLSNPQEGKRLASPAHRQDLAESIARGVMAYFDKYAPARLGSNDPR